VSCYFVKCCYVYVYDMKKEVKEQEVKDKVTAVATEENDAKY